jgi:hypothetical protein
MRPGSIEVEKADHTKEKNQTSGKLLTAYSVTVTPGTPQNWADLGALISGLTGLSSSQAFTGGGVGDQTFDTYVAVACQDGTEKLPFDMNVAATILQTPAVPGKDPSSPQAPNPGNVVCSGSGNTTPCATSRTFTSQDREYWDVSIGVTIPGVRETKYTFSTTSMTATGSPTRHTDPYALFDAFPFGYVVPKESAVPHVVVGIPVTSQSLYRPFFGLSENLTGWTGVQKKWNLPVGINFIAGVTWMKTQVLVGPPPTTQAEFNKALQYPRVWKGVFGIEVPVSSIASKLGGKGGSKNANGNGKSSS